MNLESRVCGKTNAEDSLPTHKTPVGRISPFGSKRGGVPLIQLPKCTSPDTQKSLTAPSKDEKGEDHKDDSFCFHGAPHDSNTIKREAAIRKHSLWRRSPFRSCIALHPQRCCLYHKYMFSSGEWLNQNTEYNRGH